MTPPATSDKPKQRRDPQVFAKNCPKCGSKNTRVQTTKKVFRYCKCLDCPKRWRQVPE